MARFRVTWSISAVVGWLTMLQGTVALALDVTGNGHTDAADTRCQ